MRFESEIWKNNLKLKEEMADKGMVTGEKML